jgi:ABC-type nitrate/sulfonate/bicarbonate transport system substrate-binding protein
MSHLSLPTDVPEASRPVLDVVQRQLGMVPNMFRLIAVSPAVLVAFIANNEEIALSQKGSSLDARAAAMVRFAVAVVPPRGHLSAAALQAVHDAGYSDGEIVEILAVIAENILTNLLNVVAEAEIDFPVVRAVELA